MAEKKITKTADASFAAETRSPGMLICRSLHGCASAHLPDGSVVVFGEDGLAEVTREQAEHLQDAKMFAFDVTASPVLPHSDLPSPTRAEDGKE